MQKIQQKQITYKIKLVFGNSTIEEIVNSKDFNTFLEAIRKFANKVEVKRQEYKSYYDMKRKIHLVNYKETKLIFKDLGIKYATLTIESMKSRNQTTIIECTLEVNIELLKFIEFLKQKH